MQHLSRNTYPVDTMTTKPDTLPARAARIFAAYLMASAELDRSSADRVGEDSLYTIYTAAQDALAAIAYVWTSGAYDEIPQTRAEARAIIAAMLTTLPKGDAYTVSVHRGTLSVYRADSSPDAEEHGLLSYQVESLTADVLQTRENLTLDTVADAIIRQAISMKTAYQDIAEQIVDTLREEPVSH